MTLGSLESIASRLAGIPGRKNLIWISDGFPLISWGPLAQAVLSSGLMRLKDLEMKDQSPAQSFQREGEQALHLLDEANVAIYPIEARGLLMYWHGPKGPATTAEAAHDEGTEQAMEVIAQRTGGRAFLRTNDILGAIRTAVDDSRVSYTLGFYPDSRFDGKFHPIVLKLSGRSGVTLRYRSGYIDTSDVVSDRGTRKRELENASVSPLDANAISLTARFSPSSNLGSYDLNLTIGTLNLDLQPKNGNWAGNVDVLLVEKDSRGNEFERVSDTISMDLKPETYREMVKTGIPYQKNIVTNPKANLLRVVVRDPATGNLGSLTVPLAELAPER